MYITCTEKQVRVSVVCKIVFHQLWYVYNHMFFWSCLVLVCLWHCYVYNICRQSVCIKTGGWQIGTFMYSRFFPQWRISAVVFLPSKMLKLCRPINICSKMIFSLRDSISASIYNLDSDKFTDHFQETDQSGPKISQTTWLPPKKIEGDILW